MAYGKEKVILGINCSSGHDSSAALIVGNKLVAAIEEERLTRIKHDGGFPYESIKFCLEYAGVSNESVDCAIVGWTPYGNLLKRLGILYFDSLKPQVIRRKINFLRDLYFGTLDDGKIVQTLLPKARLEFVEHHLAHAASAFFASPFERAGILSIDGRGEWSTGLLGVGEGSRIRKLSESFLPESLGMVFDAFTLYLGFGIFDEYKVMGLASYGEPKYLDQMRKIFRFDPDSIFHVNTDYNQYYLYSDCKEGHNWTSLVEKTFGPPRRKGENITRVHMDIASSLQARLNEVGVEIVRHLFDLTATRNLCLSGGVCLNGVMNYQIYRELSPENIFIQPASNDGGVSLGAALLARHHIYGIEKRIEFDHAYWGSGYSDEEIERELKNSGLTGYRLENAPETVAKLLADGAIIGWFQGRSEFGPRALGSRSILADPRPAENKDIVNARIKFREEFRPFAPSVMEEHAGEWFELDIPSPYMLLIPKVRKEKRSSIQAVTHVDGTARPQTVSASANPKYHAMIESFYKLTGCPMVLNTSFNVKGEPIVNSPTDAIRCFFTTGLDYLVLGDFIVSKKTNYDEIAAIAQADSLKAN